MLYDYSGNDVAFTSFTFQPLEAEGSITVIFTKSQVVCVIIPQLW